MEICLSLILAPKIAARPLFTSNHLEGFTCISRTSIYLLLATTSVDRKCSNFLADRETPSLTVLPMPFTSYHPGEGLRSSNLSEYSSASMSLSSSLLDFTDFTPSEKYNLHLLIL